MNKKEFKEYEKACKDSWKELAKTGRVYEGGMDSFYNQCPACELAFGDKSDDDCILCPVDKWRKMAIDGAEFEGEYMCCRTGEAFDGWEHSETITERKKYAGRISRMKWSYLPEYKRLNSIFPLEDEE